jgi:conjugative relaxase-like TrwC/TraI family protein
MALGSGFRYLMNSVAAGDGRPSDGTPLTRYYAESGTPPGVFVGGGLARLGLESGDTVSEQHLWRMLGVMADPVTGEPLGSVPRAGSKSQAVAGFDLTFSPPKSFSTMWALADEPTRQVLYRCHRGAVDVVIGYLETEVLHSRSGRNGIVQEDIEGAIAVSFTHWDNRSGDPQLHDHVVVWNRARSVSDGQWRTLDSRGLYKAVVAVSEMHQGVLADLVTAELGVAWDGRRRRHNDRPRYEVTGVPDTLLTEFSQRNGQVEAAKDNMVDKFVTARGRQPTATEVMDMRRRATVLTRPDKQHRSLVDMTADWHRRAVAHIGDDHQAWIASLRDRNDLPLLRADDLADEILRDAAGAVTETVAERRSVYTKANLLAEAHRLLQGVRFADPQHRIAAGDRIVAFAVDASLELTPGEVAHVPERLRRPDGTSRLRPKGHERYTTTAIWDAEERLLRTARQLDAPGVHPETVAAVLHRTRPGCRPLAVDQAVAVEQIATSGRRLDVLIGPAGAGKSTAMGGLRAVWEAQHGPGSVVGLAPSAAAAQVLGEELGIETDNTAKWLIENNRQPERQARRDQLCRQLEASTHSIQLRRQIEQLEADICRWHLQPGQLVIVDEATLAGTFALDRLATTARDAGAKLLLVGDPAQLSGVEAGGAFAMLTRDRGPHTPTLHDVRRFQNRWEADASLALRQGQEQAIDAYLDHRRVLSGDRDHVLESLHQAWETDIAQGRSSVMIAADSATVDDLNQRARSLRVATGQVQTDGVAIASGQQASVGDQVVTRQNDRRLQCGRGWVKNGDRWQITSTGADGTITVTPLAGGPPVVLPADYVTEHVELAYATTAYRAQGRTLDTAHVLVQAATTREALYVAATRGRQANHLYVDTSADADPAIGRPRTDESPDARDVLVGVLRNQAASVSAHDTLQQVRHAATSLATLCDEYEAIATSAMCDDLDRVLARAGLSPAQVQDIQRSTARGALQRGLTDARARGIDIESVLDSTLEHGGLADLADALDRAVSRLATAQPVPPLIHGLVPAVCLSDDPDTQLALDERAHAIRATVAELTHDALRADQPWTRALGKPPVESQVKRSWMEALSVVAGYRARWSVTAARHPLGPGKVSSIEQLRHRDRALQAIERAATIAAAKSQVAPVTRSPTPDYVPHRSSGPSL